jgi:HAD superfamily hydrolase (TIGR01509 family)
LPSGILIASVIASLKEFHTGFHLRQISLVIFDCDGVLVDSEYLSATVLIDVFSDIGVRIDLPFVYANFVGHSFSAVAAKHARQFGTNVPDDFEQHYRNKLLETFTGNLQAMPGIANVLDSLNIPYCLASGSSPTRVNRSLEVANLKERFSNKIFTTTMVKNGKPAPDIFLYAANAMKVLPAECLVIEDSSTGIAAAKAAGMTTWQFRGGIHFNHGYQHVEQPHLVDRRFDRMDAFFDTAPQLRRKQKA